jgi:hypothetical protein
MFERALAPERRAGELLRRLREAGYADAKGELFSQASQPAHHTSRQDILQLFRHYQSVIARDGLCGVNQNRHNFLNVLQKQSDKISAANISSATAPANLFGFAFGSAACE